MNHLIFKKSILFFLFFFIIMFHASAQQTESLVNYVNPFIGTGGHGHTYPGATMPHGMMQLSPDTRLTGWDGCSGYHYSDSFIFGFTHTHLSGTGVSDYGDILLMPMSDNPSPLNMVYGSAFSHMREEASPGYYKVHLDDDDIDVELTTTERAGMHHYTFNKPGLNNVILDLVHRDEVLESSLKIENDHTISGLRRSKAWASNQYVYFVIEFSRPFIKKGIWENDTAVLTPKTFTEGKSIKAYFTFDTKTNKDLYIKIGISAVDAEGARKNLESEIPGWDFNNVKKAGEQKWNENLSSILVKGDEAKKTIFYTSLYHTAIVPNVYMDADHRYRGMDNEIHVAEGFTYYSVFSLWDTYRAAHPLYTIIDKERDLDYIKTFLKQYEQGGRLPVWELAANETECMIGYHSVPVIVDAYMKGITNFDTKLALQAMIHSATLKHFGLDAYMDKGLIESTDEQESVSRTLEYAFDDWCIASFAKATGSKVVADSFYNRSQNYKNVLDPQTGLMRPRKNGDWLSPFEPREVNSNYTEANAWQYSFYMPQDIGGYLKLIGGKLNLEKKLDELFSTSSQTTGRVQSDITGLIGQYAHGNEPSHHISYLYNYAGRPDKTQEKIHQIMKEFYKNDPDGLIGNEDCGQMSAWYVMSAMGIYAVTPGLPFYDFGTPAFEEIKLRQPGGYFTIAAPGLNKKNFYVSAVKLSGLYAKPQQVVQLQHEDIKAGNRLEFTMLGTKTLWPAAIENMQQENTLPAAGFVINPVIRGGGISFQDKKTVSITCAQRNVNIFFTTDGSQPGLKSTLYTNPLNFNSSVIINAIAVDEQGNKSKITTAIYRKLAHDWSIKLNTVFEPLYNAGGAEGLIDGIYGDANWRRGNWQGYQGADVDVVIDLKKKQFVNLVTANFLQDTPAWIVMPAKVTAELSNDGKDYFTAKTAISVVPVTDLNSGTHKVTLNFNNVQARYVRLHASQFGLLPDCHESAGAKTHIFIDEIEVK